VVAQAISLRGSGSAALVTQRPGLRAGGAGESNTCCAFTTSGGGAVSLGSRNPE
jgi:hypothetical protein